MDFWPSDGQYAFKVAATNKNKILLGDFNQIVNGSIIGNSYSATLHQNDGIARRHAKLGV